MNKRKLAAVYQIYRWTRSTPESPDSLGEGGPALVFYTKSVKPGVWVCEGNLRYNKESKTFGNTSYRCSSSNIFYFETHNGIKNLS